MRRVLIPLDVNAPRLTWPPAEVVAEFCGATMGTTWSVKLAVPAGWSNATIERSILAELDHVIEQMSTWEPDSSISRYNRGAPGTWHELEDEFFTVTAAALDYARRTGGAYDPTVGAAVNLWGFGPEGRPGAHPSASEIGTAQRRTGWAKLSLDEERRRLFQPGGVYLDLSSIAKGFAVDQVAHALRRAGAADFLVEIGGELRGEGTKPGGTPWFIELERPPHGPYDPKSLPDMLIALHNLSVATSGDYRRAFIEDGRAYSHTIDPASGSPIAHGLASVTVVAEDCMTADALATVLMVLGPDEGPEFAEKETIAARFITRRGSNLIEHLSTAMAAMLA